MEPIACTLSPADQPARLASIHTLVRESATAVERPEPRRLTLTFEPAARERFADLVEAESRCCAFLTFDLRENQLTVTAPEGAEAVLTEMFGT